MNRRSFLTWTGAGVATAAIGHRFGRSARAAGFGEFPTAAQSLALPNNIKAKRVLEIFCYGGLSPWETLYLVRDYGKPGAAIAPNTQFHAFDHSQARQACTGMPISEIGEAFGQDSAGADVELGLYAHRLWNRPDVTDRMRVIVNQHRLEPHEAAVPQALTGRTVGQPGAGLGAHVQRFHVDANTTPSRATPHSYVFATGGLTSDNVEAAASTGMHSGACKPLLIKVDNTSGLTELLKRTTVGDRRTKHDDLTALYLQQYNDRLKWPGTTAPVRARRPTEFGIALGAAKNVDAIANVLDGVFTPRSGDVCGSSSSFDIPLVSIEAARALLTDPVEPASYVCVSDVGLFEAAGGGGYDTHGGHQVTTARNFDNMLQALLGVFNAPNEADPRKLNFDDTLVIINTEFGRTPQADFGDSRNHWPRAYATAFIGGPIKPGQKGVYGAIGPDGEAIKAVEPAECRAAALLALGIYPFSAEAFATSDVRGSTGETDAVAAVLANCFGWEA
jgi:hypothetical protein